MALNWIGRSALVAVLCLAGIATAEAGFRVTAEQRAACTPDAIRLCSSEIPDVGRVTACMRANQASLSQRCRATFVYAAAGRTFAPPNRRARTHVVLAYGPRHHASHHRWAHFNQGMAIAGQIFMGLKQACDSQTMSSQTISSEFCGYQRMIPVELLGSMAPMMSGF
jgi:hypothetical protein